MDNSSPVVELLVGETGVVEWVRVKGGGGWEGANNLYSRVQLGTALSCLGGTTRSSDRALDELCGDSDPPSLLCSAAVNSCNSSLHVRPFSSPNSPSPRLRPLH